MQGPASAVARLFRAGGSAPAIRLATQGAAVDLVTLAGAALRRALPGMGARRAARSGSARRIAGVWPCRWRRGIRAPVARRWITGAVGRGPVLTPSTVPIAGEDHRGVQPQRDGAARGGSAANDRLAPPLRDPPAQACARWRAPRLLTPARRRFGFLLVTSRKKPTPHRVRGATTGRRRRRCSAPAPSEAAGETAATARFPGPSGTNGGAV